MVVKAPLTCADLCARIVALEANLAALRQVLDERDARYAQRSTSQDAAVKSALDTSEKAIFKAESATERRFEGVNEFRQTLADQAATLMPRAEYNAQHKALEEKVAGLETRIGELSREISSVLARGGGSKEAWGYIVGLAAAAVAGVAIYLHH